jgi:HEAT repeat protein
MSLRTVVRCAALAAALLAVSSLSAADPPPEVAKLIAQLKDPNEAVRLKAAKELGNLKGEAKPALELLGKLAADPDEDVRTVAKKAIASIKDGVAVADKEKDKELVAPLVKKLKSKKAADRSAALDELATLGERARPASAAIVEAMLDPSASVRENAASCLEKVDPTIHKHVFTILYDEKRANQAKAIEELSGLGARAKGTVSVLKWYYGKKVGHSYFALSALTKIVPDDAAVVSEVLRLVSLPPRPEVDGTDGNRYAREHGLNLLDAVEASAAKKVAALVAALGDPFFRVQVINRLAKFGADAKPALPALKKLKLDSDVKVRDAASKAIEAITAE